MTAQIVDDILYGCNEAVCEFVAKHVGHGVEGSTLGFMHDGKLVAGVVYHNCIGSNIDISVAATSMKILTPKNKYAAFSYPFLQLGVNRVGGFVRAENKKYLKFLSFMGFEQEGLLKGYNGVGADAIIVGITKDKWIERNKYVVT